MISVVASRGKFRPEEPAGRQRGGWPTFSNGALGIFGSSLKQCRTADCRCLSRSARLQLLSTSTVTQIDTSLHFGTEGTGYLLKLIFSSNFLIHFCCIHPPPDVQSVSRLDCYFSTPCFIKCRLFFLSDFTSGPFWSLVIKPCRPRLPSTVQSSGISLVTFPVREKLDSWRLTLHRLYYIRDAVIINKKKYEKTQEGWGCIFYRTMHETFMAAY